MQRVGNGKVSPVRHLPLTIGFGGLVLLSVGFLVSMPACDQSGSTPPPVVEPTVVSTPFGNFTRRTIVTGGQAPASSFSQPAYLRFGPDGRLYVTSYIGTLFALTLDANHDVSAVQPSKPFGNRLLTGLAFDPQAPATDPALYVITCDSGIYRADDFTGRLSRLSGSNFTVVEDLVQGLPRSYENHMTFALEFASDGRLLISQGGNTNHGLPEFGPTFGMRTESARSAAILAADVRSESFSGINDVQIYATGIRNAYGMIRHSNGNIYVIDQGGDEGFGEAPGPGGEGVRVISGDWADEIDLLAEGGYYGHPNPARAEYAWQANLANGTPHQAPIHKFGLTAIATGVAEYTSSANGGVLQGLLLVTAFGSNEIWFAQLSSDGQTVDRVGVLAPGFFNPLDVTVGPDGTIYIAEAGETLGFDGVGPAKITVLEPTIPAAN